MSVIDEAVKANELYAKSFALGHLPMPPARKLAVLACMDARLTVEQVLGLKTGEAHIIRNAGGIATEDAVRSLIISHQLLGTQEFAVINHTDCGMLTFTDAQLKKKLSDELGVETDTAFLPFSDLEQSVRDDVRAIRESRVLLKDAPVTGFIYDVRTGRLRQVE